MPSNYTENYQLSQWEATDQVKREDFNADNAKIDAAIKAVDTKADSKADTSALATLQTEVDGKGKLPRRFRFLRWYRSVRRGAPYCAGFHEHDRQTAGGLDIHSGHFVAACVHPQYGVHS